MAEYWIPEPDETFYEIEFIGDVFAVRSYFRGAHTRPNHYYQLAALGLIFEDEATALKRCRQLNVAMVNVMEAHETTERNESTCPA